MTWTPIRTMPRGARPDFTLLRQPGNSYTTKAQQWFLDQLLALEPGSEDVDGGGYAHKPGYHDTVAHNDARSGVGKDYSARDAEDRSGPRDKTRARDWTFRDAQAANFADFARYGDRLLAAYRANDPRLAGWREYLGRVSQPVTVNGTSTRRVGMDFRKRYLRIPDSTHDWHGHFSEDTVQVESFANKWAMLTVLAGWSVAEWKQSISAPAQTTEDDMAFFDEKQIDERTGAQLVKDIWWLLVKGNPGTALYQSLTQLGVDLDAADLNEADIVAGVLAGLTPEKIAAAIPPALTRQVADELARRMTADTTTQS